MERESPAPTRVHADTGRSLGALLEEVELEASDPRLLATVSARSVAFWEPGHEQGLPAGSLVLGIGVGQNTEAGLAAIEDAAAAGCSAVAIRRPGDPPVCAVWLADARRLGVLLLLVGPSTPWLAIQRAVGDQDAEGAGGGAGEIGGVELGDVFALCDVLANMVGGPVILEDASFRVVAYSSFTGAVDRGRDAAILGRQMPPEWLHHLDATGGLERLRRSNEVVDVSDGPWHARRRLITAVRTAGHMLGVIWVAEGDRPLPGDGASRLREAAALAVPHMLRHQEGYRAQRLRRGELVRTLLEGRGQRRRYADELELPRGAALAVVAFEPESHEQLSDDVMDRVADHVSLGLQMSSRPAVVARVGAVIYAILPVPANGDARMLADLGRQTVRRPVPVMAHGLRGAMSTVARGLDVLAALRRQADDALEVLRRRPGQDFVSFDDVRPQVILARVREALAGDPALRLPTLEALAEADGADGGWHRSSLDAFLRAGGNVTLAARALDIHPTTLRYRLDRVQQVSGGIDLEDDDLRLTLALLLRLGRERPRSSSLE